MPARMRADSRMRPSAWARVCCRRCSTLQSAAIAGARAEIRHRHAAEGARVARAMPVWHRLGRPRHRGAALS